MADEAEGKAVNRYGIVEGVTEVVRSLVRPVTTIMFAGTFCYMTLQGFVPLETFLAMAGPVIGYHYSARQAEKKSVPGA